MVSAARADMLGMSVLEPGGQTVGRARVNATGSAWMRNQRRTRAWAALAVLWSAGFAGIPFLQGDFDSDVPLAGAVVLGVIYLGIAGLGIVLARRVARAGLSIEPDRIVVRGPFTTHVVRIGDAEAFVPGLQGGWGNGTPCPTLKRRGGRSVGVWALGQRNVVFRYQRLFQEIQPLCDELNEMVMTPRGFDPGRRLAQLS